MRSFGAVLIGVVTISAVAVPVSAAPAKEQIQVVCDGTSYTLLVTDNGDFAAAHDVNSTMVFIPHYFSAVDAVLKDPAGTVVDTFHADAMVKGSGKQKGDVVCTYSFLEVTDGSDPSGPPAGYTFSGTGTVTGKFVG
jgi:hypothetical protein